MKKQINRYKRVPPNIVWKGESNKFISLRDERGNAKGKEGGYLQIKSKDFQQQSGGLFMRIH